MPLKSCFILLLTALAFPAAAADTQANAVFLVAGRGMDDPRFRESVVLVTQPRQGGPWGVIVNRPLQRRLSEVITDHAALKESREVLFYGGPVAAGALVFLVQSAQPPPRSIPVLRDVYFTGDTGWIDAKLGGAEPTRGLRVYSGYSGWAAGQLQNELRRGDWHLLPADAATIFEKDPAGVWRELIARATAGQARKDEGERMKDERFYASAPRDSSLIPHPSSLGRLAAGDVARAGGDRP